MFTFQKHFYIHDDARSIIAHELRHYDPIIGPSLILAKLTDLYSKLNTNPNYVTPFAKSCIESDLRYKIQNIYNSHLEDYEKIVTIKTLFDQLSNDILYQLRKRPINGPPRTHHPINRRRLG